MKYRKRGTCYRGSIGKVDRQSVLMYKFRYEVMQKTVTTQPGRVFCEARCTLVAKVWTLILVNPYSLKNCYSPRILKTSLDIIGQFFQFCCILFSDNTACKTTHLEIFPLCCAYREMMQQVKKELDWKAVWPEFDLWNPCKVGGENRFHKIVLLSLKALLGMHERSCTRAHTHTHRDKRKKS